VPREKTPPPGGGGGEWGKEMRNVLQERTEGEERSLYWESYILFSRIYHVTGNVGKAEYSLLAI